MKDENFSLSSNIEEKQSSSFPSIIVKKISQKYYIV